MRFSSWKVTKRFFGLKIHKCFQVQYKWGRDASFNLFWKHSLFMACTDFPSPWFHTECQTPFKNVVSSKFLSPFPKTSLLHLKDSCLVLTPTLGLPLMYLVSQKIPLLLVFLTSPFPYFHPEHQPPIKYLFPVLFSQKRCCSTWRTKSSYK